MFYIIYRLPHTLVWGEDHYGQPPRNMWHRVIHYNVSSITYSHATVVAGATCYEDEPPTPSDHSDVVLQTSQHHCRTDVGWSEEDVAELKLGRTCTFMYVMLYTSHICIYMFFDTTYIHTYIHTYTYTILYRSTSTHDDQEMGNDVHPHNLLSMQVSKKCMHGKNVWASSVHVGILHTFVLIKSNPPSHGVHDTLWLFKDLLLHEVVIATCGG